MRHSLVLALLPLSLAACTLPGTQRPQQVAYDHVQTSVPAAQLAYCLRDTLDGDYQVSRNAPWHYVVSRRAMADRGGMIWHVVATGDGRSSRLSYPSAVEDERDVVLAHQCAALSAAS